MAASGPREQWGPVCCHLAAYADYFKTKPFGAIASLGNLAEHSSRFIAPVLIRHCMGVVCFIKQKQSLAIHAGIPHLGRLPLVLWEIAPRGPPCSNG